MTLYRIASPQWKPGGCTNDRHIKTPDGWIGLRREHNRIVVTGSKKGDWKDFEQFYFKDGEAERKAEQYCVDEFQRQVAEYLEEVKP